MDGLLRHWRQVRSGATIWYFNIVCSKLRSNSPKATIGRQIVQVNGSGYSPLFISLHLWQIRQVVLLVFAAVVLATVLNRVVRLLQRYRIKRGIAIAITVVVCSRHWLLCSDCATHCRAVATIVQYLAASLNTTACLVRLATICDSAIRTVPCWESPQQLQTWVARLLSNFCLTQ